MNTKASLADQIKTIDTDVLGDLLRRANDLDNAYRAIAEKAGQLYMKADEAGIEALTELLDKPMRNASDNQQTFSGLAAELLTQSQRAG